MKYMTVLIATGLLVVTAAGVMADEGKEKDKEKASLALTSLPAAVQATIKAQAANGKIKKIEKEIEDGTTQYVAEIKLNGRKFEAEIGEDGTLLGTEEAVKLKDVPEPVQKTIKDKLVGHKLKELEKRTEKGKEFYEFEIKGVEGETAVALDGTIMPGEDQRKEKP